MWMGRGDIGERWRRRRGGRLLLKKCLDRDVSLLFGLQLRPALLEAFAKPAVGRLIDEAKAPGLSQEVARVDELRPFLSLHAVMVGQSRWSV